MLVRYLPAELSLSHKRALLVRRHEIGVSGYRLLNVFEFYPAKAAFGSLALCSVYGCKNGIAEEDSSGADAHKRVRYQLSGDDRGSAKAGWFGEVLSQSGS